MCTKLDIYVFDVEI